MTNYTAIIQYFDLVQIARKISCLYRLELGTLYIECISKPRKNICTPITFNNHMKACFGIRNTLLIE